MDASGAVPTSSAKGSSTLRTAVAPSATPLETPSHIFSSVSLLAVSGAPLASQMASASMPRTRWRALSRLPFPCHRQHLPPPLPVASLEA
jgi:hypothetical protein